MTTIRNIDPSEIPFLTEMLYEAIFIPPGADILPKEIINRPELSRYIKDFGRPHDICYVAENNGKLIGAIWTRIFDENEKGFGYIDSSTPELSMAISKQYRNVGIGKIMLNLMIDNLKEHGFQQVSLSVDMQNFAYSFYKKHGFVDFETTEKSSTMIKSLN